MPITSSGKKAMRQSKTRRERNIVKKESYKKVISAYKKAIVAKKIEEAKKMIPNIYKALDKAAKTNAIAKNKASRTKSRIVKLVEKK
jgi:small subunit ribosomal protein S20